MLIIIAVGVSLDLIINADGFLRGLVLFFYIGLEGISILENSATIGVPIPYNLRSILVELQDENLEWRSPAIFKLSTIIIHLESSFGKTDEKWPSSSKEYGPNP